MSARSSRRGLRYRYRLVAAMLLVSLPLMVLLAVLLTSQASASLTAAGEAKGVAVARAVALRVEDWLTGRRDSLTVLAGSTADRMGSPATASDLVTLDKSSADFTLLEVTDLSGAVLASSRPGVGLDLTGQDWFRTAAGGKPVVTSPVQSGDHIQWVIAQPVVGGTGQPVGVVIGQLNPAVLADLLNPELDQGSTVVAVDAQHRLLYDTAMGKVADDSALLAAGMLRTTVDNAAVRQASVSSDPGSARYTDLDGQDVIGGYDVVNDLNWVLLAQDPADTVLAPVTGQRDNAVLIVTIGALLAIGVSIALALRGSPGPRTASRDPDPPR
jgi:methyl-accepting chemotaxis protein